MSEIDNELIEKSLRGLLSAEEEQGFQGRLLSDPDFREKVAFEKQLLQNLNENDWSYTENTRHPEVVAYTEAFLSEEAQKIKASIEQAGEKYAQKNQGGLSRRFWLFASAAVLAFVLSFLFLKPDARTSQELYKHYLSETELPDLTVRSEGERASQLLRAQGLFDNQEYEEASTIFQELLSKGNAPAALYINLALSQTSLEDYENALSTLDLLINSNLLDAQKGHWFKSLVHLKAGSTDRAKATLKNIVDNQLYNFTLAESLLSELD